MRAGQEQGQQGGHRLCCTLSFICHRVCLHSPPAFPVSTENRNDGNSLDAVSQRRQSHVQRESPLAGTPAAALAVVLPIPHTKYIPEALLRTVLFYLKQMTSPVRALLICKQLSRTLEMLP